MGADGCVYTSEYTPLQDGRARVIWQDNRLVTVLSGAPLDAGCAREVEHLLRGQTLEFADAQVPKGGYSVPYRVRWLAHGEFWRARFSYHRERLPVGLPLELGLRPYPLFVSASALVNRPLLKSGEDGLWAAFFPSGLLRPLVDSEDGLLTSISLFTGALLGLPGGYAGIFPAGVSGNLNDSANQMNAYNDLARTPGSPCAYEPVIQDHGEDP